MTWREIFEIKPVKPEGGIKPLTPAAARKRAKKQANIQNQIRTTQAMNTIRVDRLRSKLGDL